MYDMLSEVALPTDEWHMHLHTNHSSHYVAARYVPTHGIYG